MDDPRTVKGRIDGTFSQRVKRNPADALIEAEGIISLAPDNGNAWCLRGNALLELERYEDAFGSFERATRLRPELVEAWQGKGSSLLMLQRYEEALSAFKKAPNNYLVCYERGCALWSLGKRNEASDALQESLRLNREDRTVLERSRLLLEKVSKTPPGTADSHSSNHSSPHTYNSPS